MVLWYSDVINYSIKYNLWHSDAIIVKRYFFQLKFAFSITSFSQFGINRFGFSLRSSWNENPVIRHLYGAIMGK